MSSRPPLEERHANATPRGAEVAQSPQQEQRQKGFLSMLPAGLHRVAWKAPASQLAHKHALYSWEDAVMHRSTSFNKYDAVYLATGFSKESHWLADCADLRGTRSELVPTHVAGLAVHVILSGQPPSNQVSGMLSDCQRLLSESDLLDLLKLYPGLRKLRLMAGRQATLTFEHKRDLRRALKLHVPLIQGPHFATTFETLDDAADVIPTSSGSAKTKDEVKAMVVRLPAGALLSPKSDSGETARFGVKVILQGTAYLTCPTHMLTLKDNSRRSQRRALRRPVWALQRLDEDDNLVSGAFELGQSAICYDKKQGSQPGKFSSGYTSDLTLIQPHQAVEVILLRHASLEGRDSSRSMML